HHTFTMLIVSSFLLLRPPPPPSTLFTYTTLFRSRVVQERPEAAVELRGLESGADHRHTLRARQVDELGRRLLPLRDDDAREVELDRKSTRLNSSHLGISYAVFCLKKKKKHKQNCT